MEKRYTDIYHDNFIKAVKQVMADSDDLRNLADVAGWLVVGKVTLYKIMDKKQAPTVEHGITLCKKGGFNANWLFLDTGAMKMKDQNTLNDIAKLLKSIKTEPANG